MAVTLPSIGFSRYVRVSHRITYPYSPRLPSVLAVANVKGVHNRTTQTLFKVILLPQRCLILGTRWHVNTSPATCPMQGRRARVSPNFPDARETCIRLLLLSSFQKQKDISMSSLTCFYPEEMRLNIKDAPFLFQKRRDFNVPPQFSILHKPQRARWSWS